MYVCVCKAVTDKQIRAAVDQGAESMREVRRSLGVSTQCGRCACVARDVFNEALNEQNKDTSLFYSVA